MAKTTLKAFFEAIETAMPSIVSEPGYFRHNPYLAVKLAQWIDRFQDLCDAQLRKNGEIVFTVFDLETTGLESAHKFEVGLAGVTDVAGSKIVNFEYMGNAILEDGTQLEGDNPYEFQSLSNPGVVIPDAVVEVTNITNEMVADAPSQREVFEAFREFSRGTILVGHNIGDSQFNKRGFDIPRVYAPIAKTYWDSSPTALLDSAVDTYPMFKHMIAGVSHKNADMGERLGYKLVGAHRAMPDVRVNAAAFAKLAKAFYECPTDLLVNWANVRLKREKFNIYFVSGSRVKGAKTDDSWVNIAMKIVDVPGLSKEVAIVKYWPASNRFEYPEYTKSGKFIGLEQSRQIFSRDALFRQVSVFRKAKDFESAVSEYTDIVF